MEQQSQSTIKPQLSRAYRIVANVRHLEETVQRLREETYALAEELEHIASTDVTGEAAKPPDAGPLAAAAS